MTTPSTSVTARMIPPPGCTCDASSGGTVGERSRQPSSSSSIGREPTPRNRAVLDRARAGLAAVALRQPRPVREVVARRPGVARRRSGGRARPARPRDRTARAATAGTKTRSASMHDPPLHRGAREQVDDRLALDRDAVAGEVLLELRRASPARAPRSARPPGRPRPRSRPAAEPPHVGRLHPRREQRVQPREVVRAHEVQRRAHQPRDPHAVASIAPPRTASARAGVRTSCACTASRCRRTSPPGRVQPLAARAVRRLTHPRRTPRPRAWPPAGATRPRSARRASPVDRLQAHEHGRVARRSAA